VHGNKGIYELVYFVKESKSLEKFKKQAIESDKFIEKKTNDEIEKLVTSTFNFSNCTYASLVLENFEAQCAYIRSGYIRYIV